MNQLNFNEFVEFQKRFIPEGACMIWEVQNREEFDRFCANVSDGVTIAIPPTLVYYLWDTRHISEPELEGILNRMLKKGNSWYHITLLMSFADRIHEDSFLMRKLKQIIPVINKWFLDAPRFKEMTWVKTIRISKTNTRTLLLKELISEGITYFNEKNPDNILKSEFGVLPGEYESYARDYANAFWEAIYWDGKHFSRESYWEEFKNKHINYYRYTVYLLLNDKLRELLSQEEPYSLEDYYTETQFHPRYGKSVEAEWYIVRVLNILSYRHPASLNIDSINTFFYESYENLEGLNTYLDYFFFLLEYKKFFESTAPSQFLNIERMEIFLYSLIRNNSQDLNETTKLRIDGLLKSVDSL